MSLLKLNEYNTRAAAFTLVKSWQTWLAVEISGHDREALVKAIELMVDEALAHGVPPEVAPDDRLKSLFGK